MPATVQQSRASAHPVLPEMRPSPAKADLRKADVDGWRERVGRAIERVQQQSGLSLKEFAAAVARDERQVSRWFLGTEHPQLAAIFAVERLRQPLLIVLAELAGDRVEITTEIKIRRQA